MSSVTKRISEIKQPRGGYVKPSQFEIHKIDDGHILMTAKGVTFRYPLIFIINVVQNSLSGIGISQDIGDVTANKVWLSVDGHGPDGAELVALENL